MFGVKADASWTGPKVLIATHEEYQAGVKVLIQDYFRVYGSDDESFEDRVNYLKSNPRYSDLFKQENLGNPEKEAQILQISGYATDKNYANKLIATTNGPTMKRALSLVETAENNGSGPIYIDPQNRTTNQLSALGYGPTGWRLGTVVPNGDGYSKWEMVNGNYILSSWDNSYDAQGNIGPANKIYYFDNNLKWQRSLQLDSTTNQYQELTKTNGSVHATADGDLVLQGQTGNSWSGVVLSGDQIGKSYVFADRNLDADGNQVR